MFVLPVQWLGDIKKDDGLDDIIAAAELLNIPELIRACDDVKNDHKIWYITNTLLCYKSEAMKALFFNKALYSDITFVVNGKKIPAHRCVLTTRCEVMSAMFSGQFAESKNTEVRSCDAECYM